MGRAKRRRIQLRREQPVQRVRIYYPSGASWELEGIWIGPMQLEGETAICIQAGSAAHLLDPRGVCINADTGEVLYNPRMQAQITPWVIEWLREHPEWPAQAEIPGVIVPQQAFNLADLGRPARSGLPVGTRVEKVNTEPGDAHQDGDTGTVVGSIEDPQEGVHYSVEWDDLPGMPVAIAGHRVRAIPGGNDAD